MDQAPNTRPLKKRHTKPCKYFQTMTCPRSADECHFSHTLASYEKRVEQCRYLVAGGCSGGEWCPYSHTHDAEASYAVKQRNMLPVLSIPPNHTPYHTPSPMWTPYGSAYYNIHYRTNDYVNQDFISPTDQPPSESSGASQSGSSCEEVIFTTEDPGYEEHPHSHQSQILVSEEPPLVHVSPLYPSLNPIGFPPTPAFLAFPPVSPSTMVKVPKVSGRARSRSIPRQKLANYRTKPCKFFTEENGCPRGDRCTFIHSNNKDGPSNSNGTKPVTPKTQEDSQKKDYFPVNWRVIGGGVPVSNKRGRSFSEADCTSTVVAPGLHRTTGGALDSTPPVFSGTPFPPIGEERDDNTPAKPRQRARANSIPSAPRMTHVNSNTLFAAESPGVL
ncbi:hypothetical protein BD779DRAFT_740310 [Infundibulicybe gibba]|nr:hypothetical protein BD779DRAFT_740310 [Infundibulicybe gibba]